MLQFIQERTSVFLFELLLHLLVEMEVFRWNPIFDKRHDVSFQMQA